MRPLLAAIEDIEHGTAKESNNVENNVNKALARGDKVSVEIYRFGPLGASCIINGDQSIEGIITQKEIQLHRQRTESDILVGDVLAGYVDRIREVGIDITLRQVGINRLQKVKKMVLDALQGSPTGSIPVGDKSTPEDISTYFYGISKTDFKNAVSALYKEKELVPGKYEISLPSEEDGVDEGEEDSAAAQQEPSQEDDDDDDDEQYLDIGSLHSSSQAAKFERDTSKQRERQRPIQQQQRSENTIFVGNMPYTVSEDDLRTLVEHLFGRDSVESIRIVKGEGDVPKGFGYLDLKDTVIEESSLEMCVAKLNNKKLMGRSLRVNPANMPRGSSSSATSTYERRAGSRGDELAVDDLLGRGGEDRFSGKLHRSERRKGEFKLFVGNLAYEMTETILKEELEMFVGEGTVADVRVISDRDTGRSKGFAYVDMMRESDARTVYEDMHGKTLMGRRLNVDKPKEGDRKYDGKRYD